MMQRILSLLVVVFALNGCGFTPVHGKVDDYDIEIATYLASVELRHRSGMMGQKLENLLEDQLNPNQVASLYGPSFRLEFTVTSKRDAVVMEQDGAIMRFNILLLSNYVLIDGDTREVLDRGTIRRTASYYNAPEKFSAYISERHAEERALKEMSEDYRMRLAAYFAGNYKLGPRSR